MEEKEILENLPETYKGYPTKELLKTWEEIKSKDGTKSSRWENLSWGFINTVKIFVMHDASDTDK